tara:strand:+ start:27347 stop:27820 length:474 start_codon:yes stop_codon:yes gene_type:complete
MKNKIQTISVNRKARYNYQISDTYEAGIVLTGHEIKAIRKGQVSLAESFVRPEKGELWLYNTHIASYESGSMANNFNGPPNPTRKRKLLMHKRDILKLNSKVMEKGLTIMALKIYIKGHKAKAEIGLAKGKKSYDKRRSIMERDLKRETRNWEKRRR